MFSLKHNLLLLLACVFIASSSYGGGVSKGAVKFLPLLKHSFQGNWPNAPLKHIAAGQIEQESQWNEKAHLHTKRENGYGLTQMTITPSFNIYKDAVQMNTLKSWDWQKDKYAPDKQLTFLVLQDKSNFNMWKKYTINELENWKFTLVSYNSGSNTIVRRRVYAEKKGIPKDRWTKGLELAHPPSEDHVLYGGVLWKAINAYPTLVVTKSAKYKGLI